MQTQIERVFNFSAGPAVLPETVLQKAAEELVALPGVGSSILEVSHRGKVFTEYLERAREGLRDLLQIGDDHEVIFLQGGSRLQFAMIPMNFLANSGRKAAYVLTGSWGKHAYREASLQGEAECIWSDEPNGFRSLPADDPGLDPSQYSYYYYVSNETIQGVQFPEEPETHGVPRVCDASSDFLHKPIPIDRYDLIYACAQKNAGAAGLTIVVARKSFLETGSKGLPGYLDYRSHAANGSLFNTPPTFAIYIFALIVDWIREEIGGLETMHEMNQRKAAGLYEVIDRYSGFYNGHAAKESRSLMNVVFNLPDENLTGQFLQQAEANGMTALAGHRSVGGIRASIYNAMPMEGVKALSEFMIDFAESHG